MYYLRGWKPRISALNEGRYSLKIKAKLECDDCGEEFLLDTAGSIVSLDGTEPKVARDYEVGQVLQQRNCPKCTSFSRLGETDTEKLRREAEKIITAKWINSQLRK